MENTTTNPVTDALGNELILGNLYGYSSRTNGIAKVILGICTKINPPKRINSPSSATLTVIERGSSIYTTSITREEGGAKTISPAPNTLFPLPDDTVANWKED